ncbi:signal transduction histidine kinase [Microbacterium halimionae]|uniref:Signal transduction histidine kinase n=1 Tax=Microbacterium halimionae TaxID=1526413 RepID=A0A7W3PM70_9MICO|nr:ATP-binding protein [Microbacterium halimionae]MBA8816687.1 signal transduction histidine kinase [Microbacterium halimionae]NII95126.1 signal transduction histidine kinase [Microbacterium halimionae]
MNDRDQAVLSEAWRYIPSGKSNAPGIGSFSRTRVDRMIAFLIGAACIVHGAQAFGAAISVEPPVPPVAIVITVAAFVALLATILGCLVNVLARPLAAIFAVVYVVGLMFWPLAYQEPVLPSAESLWQFYLVDIAVAAAVVAFRLSLQFVWAIAAPIVYGAARMAIAGFDSEAWLPVGFEVSFGLLLGGALVAMAWAIRSAASNVDAVRTNAVRSYADAAAVDAAENERVAVAALMHDSVLGALLAAERADTPRERTLAVTMAREAMSGLAHADSDDADTRDENTTVSGIADEIQAAAKEFGIGIPVERDGATEVAVTGRVARVLTLAAIQAVANAVQHAGGAGLSVSVRGKEAPTGVSILITDAGPGFDVTKVPGDRLGVRGSIIARVSSIGGHADIQSNSDGTVIAIEWQGGDRW